MLGSRVGMIEVECLESCEERELLIEQLSVPNCFNNLFCTRYSDAFTQTFQQNGLQNRTTERDAEYLSSSSEKIRN